MPTESGWVLERKSPMMIGSFLCMWALSLILFGPRLFRIIATSKNIIEFLLLFTFCLIIIIFWLLACYYVAVALFSLWSRTLTFPPVSPGRQYPKVAILYPTCNDFQIEAATSCLNQDYPNFHLYLLDDSNDDEFRMQVNEFHALNPETTTIIRRPTRQGFKAGNLNYALRGAAANYPYFAVMDADERIPTNFLRRVIPLMQDSDLAFVQANHIPNPNQNSLFAKDIAPTILPFWNIHCRPRNLYGFVLYLGHGAVVRRNAWDEVGGFPEVVLEDLAFSAILGEKGLRGVFLDDLVCHEDFAANYSAFKRQHERYIIGTTQVMHKYLIPLLKSRRISLVEKIDFCLWCSPLYVPALCLVYAAVCGLGLAWILGSWSTLTISIFGHELMLPAIRILDEQFSPLWSWDFQLFSAISAFAPALACLVLGFKGKLNAVRLLFLSTVPYLSVMVVSWRGILSYLFLGRTFSPPTGESVMYLREKEALLPTGSPSRNYPVHPFVWNPPRVWEICLGGLLTLAALMSFNIAISAICCCLLVGIWIEIVGWENKLVRVVSISCFAIVLLQILLNLTLLTQSPGMIPLVFSVHF
jgi:cellulose synthase/poly-beta-1,6-N-acetylglucosamine synthase-like glycosyltransferase